MVISSMEQAASNASNESSPLVSSSAPRSKKGATSSLRLATAGAVFVVAVALIVQGILHHRISTKPVTIAPQEPQVKQSFRPYCETYGRTTARIIQTSLAQPSQQWNPLPCYSTDPEKGLFGRPKKAVVDEYQVPDAVLQVDFDTPALANRSVPILGFGGAFTEAAALNYHSLSKTGRKTVMELLFGESGLGYSLGRVHINSCDFSVKSYNFDNTDGDFELKDFDMNLTHDVESGMLDMILSAQSVFSKAWGQGGNESLKMYASPWSPPPWMKKPTPDDPKDALHAENMTSSAKVCLRDGVGPDSQYAKAWALYFSKFINAYTEKGVPIWAITIQNEPEFAAPWEACAYTAKTEGEFLINHLGPQLRKSHPDLKIFIFDHNKDHAPMWIKKLLNSTAAEYVDGTAIHWYAGGMDRLLDGSVGAPNMHRVFAELHEFGHKEDHIILGSEACHCPYTGYAGGDNRIAWARAERYAHSILADLAAGSNAWVEWNLILDAKGGPNHLGNLCDTTLLAVPNRALNTSEPEFQPFEKNRDKFGRVVGNDATLEELNALGYPAKFLDAGVVVQPMYYYMGHISRHVRPGSIAVKGLVDSSAGRTFRPPGQTVAGGGINDLARNGIELTVWPCEGSTRQTFKLNKHMQLEVSGHDWLGMPTKSCIGKKMDPSYKGLLLGTCNRTFDKAGIFEVIPVANETVHADNIQLKHDINGPKCLAIEELKNDGGAYGTRGGSQVVLGNCSDPSAIWTLSEETGEISSSYFEEGEVCMTTGWPFLQMGAFLTPNGETKRTIVILNEAAEGANYIIRNKQDVVLTGVIPAHSIQTVVLDN